MTTFFITATGTDIGKTFVTAGLAWQLAEQGSKVRAIKPVISGFDEKDWRDSDTALLLRACGTEETMTTAAAISPWRYREAVSPHLAGEAAPPAPHEIEEFCRKAMKCDGTLLIEGAGGVMTPLGWGYTQLDLLEELNIPSVLVAGSYVGTISHTLTAFEAMRARGRKPAAIIISETPGSLTSLTETQQSLEAHLAREAKVLSLPRQAVAQDGWKKIPSLLEALRHD